MKKTQALTTAELDCIAKRVKEGDGKLSYKFDLSRISVETFDSLIKSIPGEFLAGHYGIGFNCDLLVKTDRKNEQAMLENPRSNKKPVYPLTLQNSAARRKKQLSHNLVRAVGAALAKEHLNFLGFRFLNFSFDDVENLSTSIYKCNSLRVLKFCGVNIGDKGMMRLCRALRKRSITEIQLRQCGLTDKCVYDLESLLSFHVFVQSEAAWKGQVLGEPVQTVCLQSLDLRDNEFTHRFVEDIANALLDVPIKLLDLRGNIGVTDSMVKDIRKDNPSLKLLTGISTPAKSTAPKFTTHGPEGKGKSDKAAASMKRIKQLEDENKRLHALIEELQMGVNIAELEPNLKIVGQRAQDFVESLTQLDNSLAKSTRGPAPFLQATKKRIAEDVRALVAPKKRRKSVKKAPRKTAGQTTTTTTRTMTRRSNSTKPSRSTSTRKIK